jgi:hypothetical protein
MEEKINLGEIPADFATGAQELTGPQKAQIAMTYWVLGGSIILLILSGLTYAFTTNEIDNFASDVLSLCTSEASTHVPDFCKKYVNLKMDTTNTAAKEFFEFCKNFIPPIVTLVLGAHYVTKSRPD